MKTVFKALVFFAFWQGLASVCVGEDALVVLALRQFQIHGPSNIHLYLYSLDGTLKKVLTKEPGLNDQDPAFSWDGKTILFTRQATDNAHQAQAGKYVLDLDSGTIRRYDPETSDEWYTPWDTADRFDEAFSEGSPGWLPIDANSYLSSDGKYRITRVPMPQSDGHTYNLAEGGGRSVPIASFPGFMPADQLDGYESFLVSNGSPFVTSGDFAAVFLSHHLGSSDGNQIWGLDLNAKKWTKISENGALLYHPPSAAGIFSDTEERYQMLGNTGHTVNCSYLDWWDAHLNRHRLGPPFSYFYSAAIFHNPGCSIIIADPDGS